jgi:co-chaperonin GroES (HSP10)
MIMEHVIPPDQAILDKIGDTSDFELFNNQVLVATYMRPDKTASGLYLTDQHRDEDKFQSKVGLIIKMGPSAFQDARGQWFKGETFSLHQWVVFRPADGWSITVNDTMCRVLDDTNVRARIQHPDTVW